MGIFTTAAEYKCEGKQGDAYIQCIFCSFSSRPTVKGYKPNRLEGKKKKDSLNQFFFAGNQMRIILWKQLVQCSEFQSRFEEHISSTCLVLQQFFQAVGSHLTCFDVNLISDPS